MSKVKASGNPFSQAGPAGVTFGSITDESSNSRVQSLTVTDENGRAVTAPTLVWVWLSDNADGTGVVASAASSALAAGTNGKLMATVVSGKIALFQTKADGTLDVNITDTATRAGIYLCVAKADGSPKVSSAIAFT